MIVTPRQRRFEYSIIFMLLTIALRVTSGTIGVMLFGAVVCYIIVDVLELNATRRTKH